MDRLVACVGLCSGDGVFPVDATNGSKVEVSFFSTARASVREKVVLNNMGFLRLILALSVVIGHADHSFGLPGLNTTLAVRSFYIISGFYMALVLSSKYRNKPYYVFIHSRYMRLFPVYSTVLALTIVYGFVTYAIIGSVQWPLAGWAGTVTGLSDSSILCYALSNVFLFGQDILGFFNVAENGHLVFDYLGRLTHTAFGGYMLVPQAWTLGLELTFYLVAPFFIARSVTAVAGVIAGSCLLRFGIFPLCEIDADAFGYRFFPFEIIYFCFGGLAYKLYAWSRFKDLGRRVHVIAVLTLALPFLSFTYNVPEGLRYTALALSIPSLFLLTRDNNLDRLVGELSYPVYISHILVLYALTQYMNGGNELPSVILTLLLSILLYVFVERRAEERRKRIVSGLPRRFPTPKGGAVAAVWMLVAVAVPFAFKAAFEQQHLARSVALVDYDFLKDTPANIVLIGFDPPEHNVASIWRWGLGAKSEILFSLPQAANFTLTFNLFSLHDAQTVTVFCNDLFLEELQIRQGEAIYRQYRLPARKSDNVIRFVYGDWNGRVNAATRAVPNDSRPLSVCFTALTITF